MSEDEAVWDAVFHGALQAALAAQPPRLSAWDSETLADRLLEMKDKASRLRTVLMGSKRLWNPRFVRYLLKASAAARLADPELSQRLASLAVEYAEMIRPADVSPLILAHLRAEAWAALGNTQRADGEYREAERSFRFAEERLAEAGPEPLLESELRRYRSHLRRAQRRFKEALGLAQGAAALAEGAGGRHEAGLARLAAAIVLNRMGRSREAVQEYMSAGRQVDPGRSPGVLPALFVDLAAALADSGDAYLALSMLIYGRDLFAAAPPAIELAATWLEGRLAGLCGELRQAVFALREVRAICRENGNDYDFALSTIDLCLVWAKAGRRHKVNDLAHELLPLADSPRIPDAPRDYIAEFAQRAAHWAVEAAWIEEVLANLRDRRRRKEPADEAPAPE